MLLFSHYNKLRKFPTITSFRSIPLFVFKLLYVFPLINKDINCLNFVYDILDIRKVHVSKTGSTNLKFLFTYVSLRLHTCWLESIDIC